MKSFLKLTSVIILSGIIFASCSTSNEQGKMIPKNALIVAHINSKSLLSKLSWDEIKQTSWFKELNSDTSAPIWTKNLMEDPSKTGIDISSGFYIFWQKPAGTDGQIVFEGEVKDTKDFEAFNKNLDATATTSKDGDVNMLTLKNRTVVGWNNKKFAYIINSPSVNYSGGYSPDASVSAAPAVSPEKLSAQCKSLFTLSSDNNMEKVKRFGELLKEDGDIHVWQNTEQILNSSNGLGALSMLKLDAFFKENISTITASFDNGQIDIKQKTYAGKELTDLLKKYGGGKINTDLIKNIPSQNVTGLVALHFDPEGLREILKLTGMGGMANMGLAQAGITIDDFIKANKGDVLFAATDLMVKKDSFSGSNNPHTDFLFAVNIGDKPSFDKLMNAGKKLGGDMEEKNIAYANNDKVFVIGNTQSVITKYIAGSNNKFPFLDKLNDYPVAAFVDIQKILNTISSSDIKDSAANVLLAESIKMWDNVYVMGGNFKDDAFAFHTEINLVDKSTNSLKQLNKYFDSVAKVIKEKEKENKHDWSDSTALYPPISDVDTTSSNPGTH